MKKKLLLLFSIFVVAPMFSQPIITVGPYLQSPTPNSIIIKWQSDLACTSKVIFGTSLSNLNQIASDTTSTIKHTIKLTGLAANTSYFYAVYNGNNIVAGADSAYRFKTFPVSGTNQHVRAWAIGDFGKGNDKQARVRDSYLDFDSVETNLWLWLGDNVYPDGTEEQYLTKVFDSVYGFKNIMTHLPFEPCPGNHDYNSISPVTSPVPPLNQTGPYFDLIDVYKNAEAGGVATGHELFYSFNYANAHFVSLNSEIGSFFNTNDDWVGINTFNNFSSSPMSQWLHQDLAANTLPWVVVYFHQPPYTDGSHDSGTFWEVFMKAMRENYAEIFEQYGVDLVLSGHSHVYERSYLVKGAYGSTANITEANILQNVNGSDTQGQAYIKYTQGANANEGTIYVVNGNSGSVDEAPGFNHPYMVSEYGCDTCCGSFILDIDSNRLDGRHLDMYGNIQDHFTLYKLVGESPSTINENENEINQPDKLTISPNPFTHLTKISFYMKQSEKIKLILTDINGKQTEVFEGTLTKGIQSREIDVNKLKLTNGVYILSLITKDKTLTETIIVN